MSYAPPAAILAVISLVLVPQCGGAGAAILGTWRGTYNSMPTALQPDGSYPEGVNTFRLLIRTDRSGLLGRFESVGDGIAPTQDIGAIQSVSGRYCFDIIADDSTDMRWCVSAHGDKLRGFWNRGPKGGPLQNGAGTGSRLFNVEARRIRCVQ